ncbi:hypothetical protein Aab01nite_69160 [Paractinoplanes abujensis]|uniref:Uncharacterized protein n=1 Tax=Paractinoplanes abujensis TaxID=882441 RepID=A0A7W7G695_9ACTN|nr:hypothetical protein [Actinoplanes abujensis]MBB4695741.1 hypothetical protein [Actinoplanes abujensis]GID23326.1 hypothetical protein Aab01nite_69160 [Actinoplanes abujensis]
MKTRQNDVVAEYLREIDQRLAGIPVLQRRELLADLEAHIAAERAERNLAGEGELIEVLERLGSPEVVAAAAHEEAGTQPRPPAPPRGRRLWPWMVAAAAALAVLVVCTFFLFFAQTSSHEEGPAVGPPAVEPS